MRKTFTLWAVIGSLITGTAFAQAPKRTCGTEAAEAYAAQQDPGYAARKQQNEAAIARFLSNPANRNQMQATKTIPVVFHVVYNNAAQNVPLSQLQAQLNVLNRDFRRQNADTATTPSVFRVLGADTQIEFCLASVDPAGQPTTGVTRTSTTVSAFSVNSPNAVKTAAQGGKDGWNRNNYLNIWVCNMGGGILGYATPPGGPAASDGVVILYSSLPGGSFAPFNQGRTATHEVGHWLNLRHIWGEQPGCADDDLVADTPLQQEENYNCPTFPLTTGIGAACPGSNTNGSMFMNYMDYVDDGCMNIFTKGQRDRMVAALNTSRASILASTACANTLAANFSASSTTVSAGNSVNFTDLSSGSPTSWAWSFQGGTPIASTFQNPQNIRYNTPGTYNVTLTVTNANGTATRTMTNYITVTNATVCRDTLNKVLPGTPVMYISRNSSNVRNGYVSGNNGFGDKAKAEYFASTAGYNRIAGGILKFGKATAAGASSSVTVAVWDNTGANGSPGAIIGSQVVPISSIATNVAANQATTVNFTTPITVNGPFYMGVQLSNTPGDTVALITNTSGDSPAGKGWEQLADNSWATYTSSWTLNISNAIAPIMAGVPPTVDFTPATSTVCLGGTINFSSALTTGATSFEWSFPGGTPSSSTSPNPTVTYASAGNWNVTLKAVSGVCNLTTTVTKPFAISVVPSPVIAVTPSASQSCGPTPVTVTATGASSYSWSPATGLNTTTGATVIANPTATTVYTVTGTTNGCSATQQVVVAVTNVTTSFTATPAVVDLSSSGVVNFTNTSSSNALFFNWNFGDPAAGALNTSTVRNPPPFTYTTPGNYTVTLIGQSGSASGNCTKTTTFTVVVRNTLGLQEAFDNGKIKIYPNPAKSYLQVEVPEREAVTEIQLTNAIGQVIARQKPAAGQARLNVSNLSNGIYFVKIMNAEGSITRKISVMQ